MTDQPDPRDRSAPAIPDRILGADPEVEGRVAPDAPAGTADLVVEVDPFAACRYLVAASGGWRASDAIREHRCAALDPPAPIALDKQRRLCLTEAHPTCPTFAAAREERGRALTPVDAAWSPSRPVVRTAPVVVGSPTRERPLVGLLTPARLGEVALGVMAVLVVVLLGARLLGGSGAPEASPEFGLGGTEAPSPRPTVSGLASPPASPATSPTGIPTGSAGPDASASAAASAAASAKPSASPARRYRVKRGDTLIAIAAKYGTTVSVIVKANKIKDPRIIHVGQILIIP